ncbi:hypothetical protein SETIT_7G251000v2 [Setaria italica]|uniref:Uncharacterized protein n=1 Tax=Setaria italica TaxID=4555 RepID=A0A368RZD2_SETIT|nr:hypothetical protein SETIT_7G251000v2 [Setaria italica]
MPACRGCGGGSLQSAEAVGANRRKRLMLWARPVSSRSRASIYGEGTQDSGREQEAPPFFSSLYAFTGRCRRSPHGYSAPRFPSSFLRPG